MLMFLTALQTVLIAIAMPFGAVAGLFILAADRVDQAAQRHRNRGEQGPGPL